MLWPLCLNINVVSIPEEKYRNKISKLQGRVLFVSPVMTLSPLLLLVLTP